MNLVRRSFRHLRPVLCHSLVALALAACQAPGTPPTTTPPARDTTGPDLVFVDPPSVRVDAAQLPAPNVTVGCDAERPWISFAEVSWPTSRQLEADSVMVDYTVFKDGFTAQRYATIPVDQRAMNPRSFFRPVTPLIALQIRPVALRTVGDSTVLRAERLDAGVNYLWRLRMQTAGAWVAGPHTRVPAPTCVRDEPGR